MSTCSDCTDVKRVATGDERYQLIDIGQHVRNLKEFIKLRDTHPKFEVARHRGLVGVPSFVLDDGTVTFKPEEAGLDLSRKDSSPHPTGASCNIDGTGC